MPKFQVDDTIACYVTWRYEIEAATAEEAAELYREGHATGMGWKESDGPFIGDALDFVPQSLDVKEVQ